MRELDERISRLEVNYHLRQIAVINYRKCEKNLEGKQIPNSCLSFEAACGEQADRLAGEEERLARVKREIADANENASVEEAELTELRAEASAVDERYTGVKRTLDEEQAKFEALVDELTIVSVKPQKFLPSGPTRAIGTASADARRLAYLGPVKSIVVG